MTHVLIRTLTFGDGTQCSTELCRGDVSACEEHARQARDVVEYPEQIVEEAYQVIPARYVDESPLEKYLVEPYRDMAKYHLGKYKKCWRPWRRWWHLGFATGLIAAIDLIESLKKGQHDKPSEQTRRTDAQLDPSESQLPGLGVDSGGSPGEVRQGHPGDDLPVDWHPDPSSTSPE